MAGLPCYATRNVGMSIGSTILRVVQGGVCPRDFIAQLRSSMARVEDRVLTTSIKAWGQPTWGVAQDEMVRSMTLHSRDGKLS